MYLQFSGKKTRNATSALDLEGTRRPNSSWRAPEGFEQRWDAVSAAVIQKCEELAGGNPLGVSRDMFVQALRESIPDLKAEEDDYARQVSLAVLQQARGSNVFFQDLGYLDSCLRQGRVHPSDLDAQRPTLTRTMFSTQTSAGPKTMDLTKTTGTTWKIPKGFLKRYNGANQEVMRAAARRAGGLAGTAMEVVEGVWGKVTVEAFVEACREVLGELGPEEEEYVAALAGEQVPAGSTFIRDLPYLDKCLQNGRTPSLIKGPELLPTVFLNNTTSPEATGLLMRHTGGRMF